MHFVQFNLFAEHIGRFANRTDYIVTVRLPVARDILDTMVCIVKSRSKQLGETGIQYGKLLRLTFFHIQHPQP